MRPSRPGPTQHTAGFLKVHPEAEHYGGPPQTGWLQQLPPQLRAPARLVAYRVSVLQTSGPLSDLGFLDVVDADQLIPQALQQAGLISIGPVNWSRGHRGAHADVPAGT